MILTFWHCTLAADQGRHGAGSAGTCRKKHPPYPVLSTHCWTVKRSVAGRAGGGWVREGGGCALVLSCAGGLARHADRRKAECLFSIENCEALRRACTSSRSARLYAELKTRPLPPASAPAGTGSTSAKPIKQPITVQTFWCCSTGETVRSW